MVTRKKKIVAELAVRRLRGAPLDVLADEIVMVSDAVKRLRKTRLTDETLHLLVQNAIGQSADTKYRKMSLKQIRVVIEGIEKLADVHLKPRETK